MLPGEIGAKGYPVEVAIWEPIAKAPRDGTKITVLHKSGKRESCRWVFGAWRVNVLLQRMEEGGSDPVTHFHA